MRAALLPDRSAIRITGKEAATFLDRIVTNTVDTLKPGEARYSALLTPQGKIVADFLTAAVAPEDGGGFILDAPAALADDLAKKLNFYKLRAKVEIVPRPDLAIAVFLDREPPGETGFVFADPRQAGLGWRVVLPGEGAQAAIDSTGAKAMPPENWDGRRISLGIPAGGKDFIYGDTFPHEADMDLLGGVDFNKGCFIGQEVVSRVERLEAARKRAVPVAFEDGAPAAGAEIRAGERPAGFMGSSAGRQGIAMLRLDRVEDAQKSGGQLLAGGIEIRLWKPDWATFPFPAGTK